MPQRKTEWTLLSKHGQVLVVLLNWPTARTVDLAQILGVSDRSIRLIISSLYRSGFLKIERVGRKNVYHVDSSQCFPSPMEQTIPLLELAEAAAASLPIPPAK